MSKTLTKAQVKKMKTQVERLLEGLEDFEMRYDSNSRLAGEVIYQVGYVRGSMDTIRKVFDIQKEKK
jgi:hypothetical protein